MHRVLEKIKKDNKEFVNSEELREYCKELYFNYRTIGDYLISRGHLLNVLDDIYYVKSDEEFIKKEIQYSTLELIAKVLKLKKVTNWYFGLYTALNLNKVNYDNQAEFLYLINNQIVRDNPIKILGKKFRFLIFKNSFFNFGIIKNKIRYSDHEKTILDLLYLWDYNNMNENRILIELIKLLDGISEEKILNYARYYPKSNKIILEKALKK
ncbi:MAG: hypothetical protein ACFE9I_12130 [Candidatus Hermodarchaeota archaeon]